MINSVRKLIAPLALALALSLPALAAPPNILWITAEDMSANLGCYGDRVARTPNLDKLATEGARFTRAFAVAPVCSPSRSAIITGMYPTTLGTHHHRSKITLPADVRCFTEYLRDAGYYCTNNVKTDYNFKPPATAWDQNSTKAHWRNRPANTPFFSVINFTTTHESKLHLEEAEVEELLSEQVRAQRQDPAKVKLPPYFPDTPVVRRDVARYYDMVAEMDRQVGEVLADLEEDGLSTNTIVFFYTDHGWGLPRGKRWLYDSGLHVPMIIRHPGTIEPGSVRNDLVSLLDLAPTVLKLAGLDAPKNMQGQVFLGEGIAARENVFGVRDRMDEVHDMMRCVRDAKFKYIRNTYPERPYMQPIKYSEKTPTLQEWRRLANAGQLNEVQKLYFQPTKPKEELYNCEADPHEVQNLVDNPAYADDLKRMRAKLDSWTVETRDLGLVPEEN